MNACLQASALGDISSFSVGGATRCRISRSGDGTAVVEKDEGGREREVEEDATRRDAEMVCVS